MTKPFQGVINLDIRDSKPDWEPYEQPRSPEEGYHFSADITDKALEFIKDAKAIAPERPFFLYFCPGACHAPHHAHKEWADKYKGKFSIAGEGLNVGRDGGEPVTGDYPGVYPWAFTGTVKRVVVDVSGELKINHEVEAHAMLMRE
jgi:hypothetical protein